MADEEVGEVEEQDEQQDDGIDAKVEALVKERLAAVKAEHDTAFSNLWEETKAAKAEAKARAKALEQQLTEIREQQQAGKAGVSAEEVAKLKEQIRADEAKRAREELHDELEKAAKLPGALEEIRNLRLDSRVKARFAENGVKADRIEKLWRLERDKFDLTDDGVPMLKDQPTADIDRYISEALAEEYSEWFNGSGASGGGASRSAAGGGGKTVIQSGDGEAFMRNLEAIASGEVEVR